jgi:hypothetical protein
MYVQCTYSVPIHHNILTATYVHVQIYKYILYCTTSCYCAYVARPCTKINVYMYMYVVSVMFEST